MTLQERAPGAGPPPVRRSERAGKTLPDGADFWAAMSQVVRKLDRGGAVFQGDTADAVVRVVRILREEPELAAALLKG